MKFKPNYIVIPAITVAVALLGGILTSSGMTWYNTVLNRPDIIPPSWAFPIAWNIIFLLTTISALVAFNRSTKKEKQLVAFLFLFNAVLNILWSLLFFKLHLISASLVEMIILEIVNLALIFKLWQISKSASLMIWPYLLWVGFATYLTYLIWLIN